jgi:hypothetical protein
VQTNLNIAKARIWEQIKLGIWLSLFNTRDIASKMKDEIATEGSWILGSFYL